VLEQPSSVDSPKKSVFIDHPIGAGNVELRDLHQVVAKFGDRHSRGSSSRHKQVEQ